MLTVWTMSTGGKYDDYYPQRLQREVGKHLDHEHRFICIADHPIDGVMTVPPPTDYPGWWGKVGLFKPGFTYGLNLWLDLDVVITGSLDELVDAHDMPVDIAAADNWAQSGHGGIQSSVMVWRPNAFLEEVFLNFKPEMAHWPPVNKPGVFWGDQEWLTHNRDEGRILHEPIQPAWIRSYKYHCRNGLPDDCRVVVFHGKPDPHEVDESWFQW